MCASTGCQQSNTDSRARAHSFSFRKPYDRSAEIDQRCDEIGVKLDVRMRHEIESDLHRQTPVVVISRMSKASKGSFSSHCNEHGINYQNVDEFVDGGILELVKEQSFLIYSQETGGHHRQVGICAALAVEDCLKGAIKRHENVVTEIPSVMKAHHTQISRNVDQVMIMFKQSEMIQSIIDRITTHHCPVIMQSRSRPDAHLGVLDDDTTAANIDNSDQHKIWSVTDQADIESIKTAFLQVDSLYIADGHHRTAAACRIALKNKDNAGLRKPSHTK